MPSTPPPRLLTPAELEARYAELDPEFVKWLNHNQTTRFVGVVLVTTGFLVVLFCSLCF